jgi:DNA-directed RNA polymerase subunit RPC12/RpoP
MLPQVWEVQQMALIQCPECQHNVSDSALACPSCGYKLKDSLSDGLARDVRFIIRCLNVLVWGTVGCLAVAVIVTIIRSFFVR